MNNEKRTDPLEVAVHVILMLLGVLVLRFAYDLNDTFWQPLWVNIGSSLVAVTFVFAIVEAFRRRHIEKESQRIDSVNQKNRNHQIEAKADELIITLRSSQQPPIASDNSKVTNPQEIKE